MAFEVVTAILEELIKDATKSQEKEEEGDKFLDVFEDSHMKIEGSKSWDWKTPIRKDSGFRDDDEVYDFPDEAVVIERRRGSVAESDKTSDTGSPSSTSSAKSSLMTLDRYSDSETSIDESETFSNIWNLPDPLNILPMRSTKDDDSTLSFGQGNLTTTEPWSNIRYPCNSNDDDYRTNLGLVDLDRLYPCTRSNPCLLDRMIYEELARKRFRSEKDNDFKTLMNTLFTRTKHMVEELTKSGF